MMHLCFGAKHADGIGSFRLPVSELVVAGPLINRQQVYITHTLSSTGKDWELLVQQQPLPPLQSTGEVLAKNLGTGVPLWITDEKESSVVIRDAQSGA